MPRYSAVGKNLSAMVHADRSKVCEFCGRTVFGNGGKIAHARGHVRRGEAVELEKWYGGTQGAGRVFLVPDADQTKWLERGYEVRVG